MSRRSYLTLGAALAAALLLSACQAGTLNIRDYPLASDAARCSELIASLPATLEGQARRTTTGAKFAVAWGKDPVVVRCGVPTPVGFDKTSACMTVNGMDWFATNLAGNGGDPRFDNTVVTTVYRAPAVELSVPRSYGTQAPSTMMIDLAAAIQAHTTTTGTCR